MSNRARLSALVGARARRYPGAVADSNLTDPTRPRPPGLHTLLSRTRPVLSVMARAAGGVAGVFEGLVASVTPSRSEPPTDPEVTPEPDPVVEAAPHLPGEQLALFPTPPPVLGPRHAGWLEQFPEYAGQRIPRRYVVAYSFQGARSTEFIEDELKKSPGWMHYLGGTWLVSTEETAEQLYHRLVPYLNQDDNALVVEITPTATYHGWLPREGWEWLRDMQH